MKDQRRRWTGCVCVCACVCVILNSMKKAEGGVKNLPEGHKKVKVRGERRNRLVLVLQPRSVN